MAASAAKFAHCQPRFPVEYRSRTPFQPTVQAPLDFAVRWAEIVQMDRELDRTLLTPAEVAAHVFDEVAVAPVPGMTTLGTTELGPRVVRSSAPGTGRPTSLGERLAQNTLRFLSEGARFSPPWTVTLAQEAQAVLMDGILERFAPGVLRTHPVALTTSEGEPLLETCPAHRIPSELQSLLAWIDRDGPAYTPLVPATALLHGFYAIRPFPVGNMFVARALATLYLREGGLANVVLVPMARASLANAPLLERLYLWAEASGSLTELLDRQADVAGLAYRTAVARSTERAGDPGRPDEVGLRLLSRARRAGGWFSAKEASGWVAGRGGLTVLHHLNDLVERGQLDSLGRTRAKRFRAVSAVREGRPAAPAGAGAPASRTHAPRRSSSGRPARRGRVDRRR